MIDKKVVAGHNLVAGEWGHTALPRRDGEAWRPRQCYCGRNDCLEQYLSGTAVETEFLLKAGESCSVTGMAELDHPEARATLERFKDRLAQSLAMVVDRLLDWGSLRGPPQCRCLWLLALRDDNRAVAL